MISAKEIVGLLEKERIIAYFILLWAGVFFFWSLSSLSFYVFHLGSAPNVLAMIGDLCELIAGVMLGMLGFKLLNFHFIETLTKEDLLTFFLLLWAASFAILGIYNLFNLGGISVEGVFSLLGALCDLGAGVVLGLISLKLLTNREHSFPPPPP